MNSFSDMLSQAKNIQEKMKEVQENLKKIEVEGVSGGELVKVVLKGDYEMKSIFVHENAKNEKKEISFKNLTQVRSVRDWVKLFA